VFSDIGPKAFVDVKKEHAAMIEVKTQYKTLLMRLDQATVDMGEGTSRNMQICAESAPTIKDIAQVLLNEHLKETQKVALMESLSRHILKIESFSTDGFQFVVAFLTNFTGPF
jgi:hypothetical protein